MLVEVVLEYRYRVRLFYFEIGEKVECSCILVYEGWILG